MAGNKNSGQHPGFQNQKGAGRPKGSKDKTITDMRHMIRESLIKAGGIDYLVRQAEENPGPYMALVGKVIPKEVEATIQGNLITNVTYSVVYPESESS